MRVTLELEFADADSGQHLSMKAGKMAGSRLVWRPTAWTWDGPEDPVLRTGWSLWNHEIRIVAGVQARVLC